MDDTQAFLVGAQDHHRLDRQAVVDMADRVPIRFADYLGILGNNAACQEGGNVQRLPLREVVAEDDGDLGIEHAGKLHSRCRGW